MNLTDGRPSGNIDTDRLSHAYIVSGGLAGTLAGSVVCAGAGGAKPCGVCPHCAKAARGVHPDIMVVEKASDKREIVVDQIRELKKDVIIVPNEAEKKAYIVKDADLMNKNAQNAFLQILEDPPSHAVFILSTDTPSALLPTVRSRCVDIKARTDAEAVMEAGTPAAAAEMAEMLFFALESGNSSLVSLMFKLEKLDKEAFAAFLSAARSQAAARLREDAHSVSSLPPETVSNAERVLVKAGEMLSLNVSAGHLSGMICANLLIVDN